MLPKNKPDFYLLFSGENVKFNFSDNAAPQEVVLHIVHHIVAPV